MTGEKITSRWLEHRHANCFQLIAAHRSIFIKWITVRLLIYSQEAADQFHHERGGRRVDAGWRAKNPKVTRKLSVYTIQCLFYHTVQRYAFSKLIPKPQILVCAKSHLTKARARHNKRWSESKMTGSFSHLNKAETSESADASLHCGVEWRPCKYTSDTLTFT